MTDRFKSRVAPEKQSPSLLGFYLKEWHRKDVMNLKEKKPNKITPKIKKLLKIILRHWIPFSRYNIILKHTIISIFINEIIYYPLNEDF